MLKWCNDMAMAYAGNKLQWKCFKVKLLRHYKCLGVAVRWSLNEI